MAYTAHKRKLFDLTLIPIFSSSVFINKKAHFEYFFSKMYFFSKIYTHICSDIHASKIWNNISEFFNGFLDNPRADSTKA